MNKIYLCENGKCCPSVELHEDKVLIGEDNNITELTKEEWNNLVENIQTGKLTKISP